MHCGLRPCMVRQAEAATWLVALLLGTLRAASASTADGTLSVLAIGDSITRGEVYSPCSREFGGNTIEDNRYVQFIQEGFAREYPRVAAAKRIQIVADALGGAGVVRPFNPDAQWELMRITLVEYTRRVMNRTRTEGKKYDWVIMMAGINDFIRGESAASVATNLEQMWRMVLAEGFNVLAVAPTMSSSLGGPSRTQHKLLPSLMEQRVAALQQNCTTNCVYFTNPGAEGNALDLWDKPTATQRTFLCDGLHPSLLGYKTLANHVCRAITAIQAVKTSTF